MLIKLVCPNKHYIEKQEQELIDNPQSFGDCVICGQKLSVVNVGEIVLQDINEQVKNNVSKFFASEGIEGTLELIERCKNWLPEKIYNLYREELRNRGLKCLL